LAGGPDITIRTAEEWKISAKRISKKLWPYSGNHGNRNFWITMSYLKKPLTVFQKNFCLCGSCFSLHCGGLP